MPNDKATLHYCHAWEAAGADDKKSDFKFPHAKTEGGPANLAACRNGLARLDSASIPDGDRDGVKAHLQAHLDDGDKSDDDKGGGKADDAARFPLADQTAWARAGHLGNLVSEERARERAIRAHRVSDNRDCFRITNADGDVATLDIYDEIGFWGVTAADFSRQLKAISAPTLTVHINSPGGDVFDGVAILNMLRSHPASKHVIVDGLAASAASFIAMAGSTVTMMPNSMLMIHDASGGCMGNAAEMKQMADLLDKVSDNIASIYAAKTKTGTVADWRGVMQDEQWYTADEAVEAGLADRVGDTDSPSDVQVATDRWIYNFYNYAGRASAPAPTPIAAVAPAAAPVEPAPIAPAVTPIDAVAPAPVSPVVGPLAPAPVAVADPPPVAVVDPTAAPTPVPAPAAAPAVGPAPANRRADDTPVWNADAFRLALKERAAQQ